MQRIRTDGKLPKLHNDLIALGFDLNPQNLHFKFDVIYAAILSFINVHNHSEIAYSFAVPHDDVRYPEEAWGMKLGKIVYSMRYLGRFKAHRKSLAEVGIYALRTVV